MATLYVYFKPTEAAQYQIRWKRSTSFDYPSGQSIVVNKLPGLWNEKQITIPDTNTDWNFEVTAICGPNKSMPYYGTVSGACQAVTFSVEYNHCTCPMITNITTIIG